MVMSFSGNPRRLAATLRTLAFPNFDQSITRQLLALLTVAFILLQPAVLMAQKGKVSQTVSPTNATDQSRKGVPRQPAPSAALTTGNLVIYRVGNGAAALASSATPVFLDEYTTSGGSPVQSIAMPTTDSGANQILTASGTASSEGLLTRSTDGNYLMLAGYDAAVGTASITSSTSATINRIIGRVNAAGAVDTTTALNDAASGGNPRSAVSTNGTDMWIDGSAGGIRYTTFGATTSTQLSTTVTNLRQTNIFNGQLYVSSQSGAFRLSTVGTGTPTTSGQTIVNLPGYPTATTSPYGFFFADLSAGVAGVDTVYVADDNSAGGTGGIQKYSLVGGNWTASGTIASTSGLRGLTGIVNGGNVTLYTTNASTLFTLTDTSGYNATITGTLTTIATAAANTAFRGVALAPVSAGTTNPSGTGAANPSTVTAGNSTTLTVTVTPGTNPTSTNLMVTGDLSSIGGSATQQFFDDGATGGDTTPGDNIFTFQATVSAGTTAGAKSLPVTITDAQARMGSTNISLTVQPPPGACGDSFTPTFTIQGSGTASPIVGTTVNTEGIVVGDFQGGTNLSGFYVQDPTGDGNTATSDGIFVFDGSSPAVNVAAGDRVRISGTVAETFNNTRINPTLIQICSTGNMLPVATVVDLPEAVNNDLERYEDMLTVFPETLTVTGNFTWGRFGELVLSSDARLYQQNSFDRPNTAGALARADLNARAYVVLDDGLSVQNPNPIPYQSPDNTRRAGDTVTGLTGILTFDFSEYRVQPTAPVTFVQANPRPVAPASVGGTLKVASSNVLNYFNGDGMGGGFPTSRGANTLAEFNRQRAKIIAALTTLNADVIGISEMENDGGGAQSALQDLVNGMNDATAPGTYVGLHSPNPGTDLIQNAIIYKPASVTPVGAQVNDINSAWDQARAPLAQIFTQNSNGEKFTFIVNHFTSKGCSASDTGIDADMGDGQGCDNGQRQLQANRLLVFIQDRKTASGDPDVLALGDYNAYGEEDPLFILEQDASDTLVDGTGGLVSETKRFVSANDRYSFQFGNQFGELDHAFATKAMNNQVSGATIWHINADEPVAIDYNTEFKTQDLYTATPYRASDHDPLVVGLDLTPPQPLGSVLISELRFRGPGGTQDEFVELYNNSDSNLTVATSDGSAGWTLVASSGSELCRVDNGTIIPARGHYLCANAGAYSLDAYATPDTAWVGTDIPQGGGVALFRTNNPANYTMTERLDAAGYVGVNELYREGAGFPTGGNEIGLNLGYSFFRSMTRTSGGLPKDTGSNAADFMAVDTNGNATGLGQNLGAPGPENLGSPTLRNAQFAVALLDPSVSSSTAPNRVRSFTPVTNGTFGTMSIRRTFINNTGMPVTRLRFRIVEVTTFPVPSMSGQADLRALDSSDIVVTVAGNPVDVRGTTLEQPPTQAVGGGWNSSMNVGFITLGAPLANGSSVSVQFLLGVEATGTFKFFVNIEALP
jgi:predicted extracellular nuclease